MSHTPGPLYVEVNRMTRDVAHKWLQDLVDNSNVDNEDCVTLFSVAEVTPDINGMGLVTAVTGNGHKSASNAYLYAAAPELFEALKALLSRLDLDKEVTEKNWWTEERKAAQEAIEKARGEK